MGMKLKAEETLPEGLKRIAREQLDDAIAHLRGERGGALEEQVHEARKCMKKTRATIRLVRKEVGGDVFDRENRRFRDIGRELEPIRDAQVAVGTLDRLVSEGRIGRATVADLRAALQEHRQRTGRDLREDGAIARAEAAVAEGRAMVDAWPVDRVDGKAFRASLKKTYKRGRKALAVAYSEPSPETFHELRKRTKYLWYYSRFLKPAASDEIGELKDRADEASDLLGLDHDLAELLVAARERAPRALSAEAERRLADAIEQWRLELECQARPLLRRIYSESPKSFARRIAELWDSWRLELHPSPLHWFTPAMADRVRALLARKQNSDESAEADAIRAELRGVGIELSQLSTHVVGAGDGFGPEHFDELVGRDLIGIGSASDFDRDRPVDRLAHAAVDVGPNEASGICPISSQKALASRGWNLGFWVVLDEAPIEDAVVAVGRSYMNGDAWSAERLPVAGADGLAATDDCEDCVRIGEWVYVFGSHYGSKEGPLERERQFVARFREAQLADGDVDLRVVRTGYRFHRLVNDALRAADVDLFPIAHDAREALVGGALAVEEGSEGELEERIEADDLPINIEGCAVNEATGGVLLGLRFPTSAEGHPLLIEIDGIDRLFDGELPRAAGVWELPQIGTRWVPAGIRGLGEGPDGTIEAITGNLDSAGKGSVLIASHPEAALARSAHHRLRLPKRRRSGRAEAAELIREFPGFDRIEGIADDPIGRTFYVIDESEHVDLRYSEPLAGSSRA